MRTCVCVSHEDDIVLLISISLLVPEDVWGGHGAPLALDDGAGAGGAALAGHGAASGGALEQVKPQHVLLVK